MNDEKNNISDKKKVSPILFLGIFFLPYFFSWVTLKREYSTTARWLSFCWLAIMVITHLTSSKTVLDQRNTASDGQDSRPEIREYVKESCNQLSNKFGSNSKLTNLQKENAWKLYQGKFFKWKVKIVEVHDATFGTYTVQFKCIPSDTLSFDGQISYDEKYKDKLMKLNNDSIHILEGRLRNFGNLVEINADYE